MKPQNIIIAIVFLLIISIFSFNFEKITGYQVKTGAPKVMIENDAVKAGQPIKIIVKINENCINPVFELRYKGLRKDIRTYKPMEDECADQKYKNCASNKYCKGDLKNDLAIYDYYTLPSWKNSPGIYKVRVYHMEKPGQKRYRAPYVEVPFKITG